MNSEERLKKQKELVEEIGRHFDKEGLQPIAGRIVGLLMVMDKEQFTFEEITEELQISKSSASTALKNLEIRGNIEYVTMPGDRKRYFQLRRQDKFALIDDAEKKLLLFNEIINKMLNLKADKNSKNALFFSELEKMNNFFIHNIAELKKKFSNR